MRDWIWPVLVLAAFLSIPRSCLAQNSFDSGKVKICYAEAGEGEPVVLIHGWMADSTMWGKGRLGDSKVTDTLAKKFRVITLDCRGHGKSGKPHDPKDYGLEMAKDVVRLLDHLKIDKAHLVGYSMGAILAGHVVTTHPDRVLSVTFAGGAPVLEPDPEDQKKNDEFVEKWEKDKGLQAVSGLLFGEQDVKALAAANRSLKDIKVTQAGLEKYSGPVLFVYGEDDWPSTKRYVTVAKKALGRGEVKVIPKADHLSTPSRPEFREAILKFLQAQKGE
jgi:pimeloyl-ACP methyl ester carboxylesterase